MSGGEQRGAREQEGGRPIVYCLIPSDLAAKVHDLLRAHFRGDPGVEVVVERRGRERRRRDERRRSESAEPPASERRRIRGASGRRVGDRRAQLSPVAEPPLPRRARRYAEQLTFVERQEPPTEHAEDLDTGRLVGRFQAGEREVFGTLYQRYYDRVYGYLRVVLRDRHEAEDLAQHAFTQVLEKLDTYERRREPFRAWLFTIARNYALRHLRSQGRVELVDPGELSRRQEEEGEGETPEAVPDALTWLSDRDLAFLVERLPLPQRQVLTLRFMLGLKATEIATVLGRKESDVRMLQSRALRHLRPRLTALREGESKRRDRTARACPAPATVIRSRRYVLLG